MQFVAGSAVYPIQQKTHSMSKFLGLLGVLEIV